MSLILSRSVEIVGFFHYRPRVPLIVSGNKDEDHKLLPGIKVSAFRLSGRPAWVACFLNILLAMKHVFSSFRTRMKKYKRKSMNDYYEQ